MKNITTFILCLMAMNAMAQTNDIKRAFEIKNNLLEATVLAYQELPNKDRIYHYEKVNPVTGKPQQFIQFENSLGELVYNKLADIGGYIDNKVVDFANAQKGTVFFVSWSYGTSMSVSSTNDGGTTWKHTDFGYLSSNYDNPVIHRMNEDVVFFYFTENSVYNFEQNIYITFDGGMNWEAKALNPKSKQKVFFSKMKVDFDKKGKITATCNYTDNENKEIGTQKFISKDFGKTFK